MVVWGARMLTILGSSLWSLRLFLKIKLNRRRWLLRKSTSHGGEGREALLACHRRGWSEEKTILVWIVYFLHAWNEVVFSADASLEPAI